MKKILGLAALVFLVSCSANQNPDISGAGATFPAPLYSKWANDYYKTSQSHLNYQAIGSGGGIKQITAKTVDFGATDKPLTEDKLNEFGLFQFPTVVGGVVPVYNVPGIGAGKIKLSGEVLADIFLGKIKNWNDAAIVKLNPDVKLPASTITVVHRSDGSGTSFLFTSYLAAKSGEWKAKVGASDSVQWPVGLGGKGNDGVAAFVKQTVGSIGYVEYAYAQKTNASYALIENKAGNFPEPKADAFAAAAAGADWKNAPGNYLLLLDQKGENAWPITGATFILLYKNQPDAVKGAAVLKFFDYGYKNGAEAAKALDYVPLPEDVEKLMRAEWAKEITSNGKPVYVSQNQ